MSVQVTETSACVTGNSSMEIAANEWPGNSPAGTERQVVRTSTVADDIRIIVAEVSGRAGRESVAIEAEGDRTKWHEHDREWRGNGPKPSEDARS
jgi:hypothetical protein